MFRRPIRPALGRPSGARPIMRDQLLQKQFKIHVFAATGEADPSRIPHISMFDILRQQ